MTGRRRFERLLSILLMSAGTLLLLYAGFSRLAAGAAPPAPNRVLAPGQPLLLEPALAPAPPEEERERPSSPAALPAPGHEPLALLPESPLFFRQSAAQNASADSGAAVPGQPLRIIIPALGVDAPVVAVGLREKQHGRHTYRQWSVPNAYAAGWHESSAPLGQPGNTVLNGHNNVHGAIFGDLAQLAPGEQIVLAGEEQVILYRVVHHELLLEQGASLRERLQNARWIEASEDERLTLVTCWPNSTNSHRLLVVAAPVTVES